MCYLVSVVLVISSSVIDDLERLVSGVIYSVFTNSTQLDNVRVMVIVWKLTGSIIRTALCWIV